MLSDTVLRGVRGARVVLNGEKDGLWRKKLSADGLNFYDWKERGTESGGSPSASAKPEMGGWIDQGCCPPLPAPPHCSTSHLPITHPTLPSSALPRLLLLARLSPSLILVPCVCVCACSLRPRDLSPATLRASPPLLHRPTDRLPGCCASRPSPANPSRCAYDTYHIYTTVPPPVPRADSYPAASASCSSRPLIPSSPSHTYTPTSPTARV